MYNHATVYLTATRDITWLHCMYQNKQETSNEFVMYLQVALPLALEEAEARKGVGMNDSEPKIKSKDDKIE